MRHMKSTGFMRRIFISNALQKELAHKNALSLCEQTFNDAPYCETYYPIFLDLCLLTWF